MVIILFMIHSEWRPQTAADGTAPKTPQSESEVGLLWTEW